MATESSGQTPGLSREILAVCGLFVALFLALALISYSLPEPGAGPASNWGGALGGFLAYLFMGFLGVTSFLLPLMLLFLSLQAFSPDFSIQRLPWVTGGISGLLLAVSGLVGMSGLETVSLFGHHYPAPGYLGRQLVKLVGLVLGGPGSLLFFLALLVISLILSLEFSPYRFSRRLGQGSRWGRDGLQRFWGWLRGLMMPRTEQGEAGAIADMALDWEAAPEVGPDDGPDDGEEEAPPVHVLPPVALLEYDHEPEAVDALTGEEATETASGDQGFKLRPVGTPGHYKLPTLALLDRPEGREVAVDRDYYYEVSKELEEKLANFSVIGKVVGISPGPVITTYEFAPAPGVKINKIVALAEDLALGLKVESVRIAGSLPGKGAIGIEIPNPQRQVVYVREILGHERFQKAESRLTMGLGMDVVGNPVFADLARMPHLLIAGATGSGKSVAVNTIICSILFKATPDEVRLLLVDPKRIELSCYEEIPHLLHPVVVDPKLAGRALQWAVREMERRYQLMEEARVKSLAGYNQVAEEKLPLIVIIIDELADLPRWRGPPACT